MRNLASDEFEFDEFLDDDEVETVVYTLEGIYGIEVEGPSMTAEERKKLGNKLFGSNF